MNEELKQIKKKYGEKFWHLCRELFPTILEHDGLLLEILTEHFADNHFLYDDIVGNELIESFKDYIYNIYHDKLNKSLICQKEAVKETPEELMEKVGYILRECKTEEEIQEYRKYYKYEERLCTFNGGRLNKAHVFFAVKKNALDIKREEFTNPRRQDEYGTSVISIQFSKDGSNTLSIKNRYNHTVESPDATFSNDLDNIIVGLTEAFENTYGIVQRYKSKRYKSNDFEIPYYVKANDGKYYKYNYEINNIYYCSNNIIIDNFEVKKYDKEKYIILDYFILDLVSKELYFYDNLMQDSFVDGIKNISKISVLNKNDNKNITITLNDDENIEITINKQNQIIKYKNNDLCEIGDSFLSNNKTLKQIIIENVRKIEDNFLYRNEILETIECPNLQEVRRSFLYNNKSLKELIVPKLEKVMNNFLCQNEILEKIECPNLQETRDSFLYNNKSLKELIVPKLETAGFSFLCWNEILETIECPNLQKVGAYFLCKNKSLKALIVPKLETAGFSFLYWNEILETIECPNLQEAWDSFLCNNKSLKQFNAPNLNNIYEEYLSDYMKNLLYSNKQKVLKK